MTNANELISNIKNGCLDKIFDELYKNVESSKERYIKIIKDFCEYYNFDGEISVFSAPGRSEIIGNHTDHQKGKAIGAGVNLDIVGVVSLSDDDTITVKSEGYDKVDRVSLSDLEKKEDEINSSASLIRGCLKKFSDLGYKLMGFNLYTSSNVLKGSGLSSSAAFETLIATIINSLFCNSKEDAVSVARIGQYAENVYFGKPSGLLDQMSSSVGGFVYMDFKDSDKPIVEKIDCDFSKYGYSLCVVDTGGNHSSLTDEYADITRGLNELCAEFKKEVLREVDEKTFYEKLPSLHGKISDRALLRAIHIYDENKRVSALKEHLEKNDFQGFLEEIKKSGRSSFMYLQNVYSAANTDEQGLSLALALTEKILGDNGAYRVHGGGFAGTIQAFVPDNLVVSYKNEIEKVFGKDKCHILFVRNKGGIKVV